MSPCLGLRVRMEKGGTTDLIFNNYQISADGFELCCVSKDLAAKELRSRDSIVFTNLAICMHWTRAKFCTDVHVLLHGSVFWARLFKTNDVVS